MRFPVSSTLISMIRQYGVATMFLTLLAAQGKAAIASDTDELTPVQVYWRAESAVNRLPPQPTYIAFTFENRGAAYVGPYNSPSRYLENSGELLRVLVRTSDGRAAVCAFKNQRGWELPQPIVGIVTDRVGWLAVTNIMRLGDFPLADFGLRYDTDSRPNFFEANTPSQQAWPIPVIGRVVAFAPPPYRIVNLGDTTMNDHPAYHFGLDPIRNPERNVLRQIWIDKATFLPVRYVALRTVLDVPVPFTYAITVDSEEIDGHLVNVDADGSSEDGLGRWRISEISFPDTEPGWVFDPVQWPRHNGEQIPNLAASASGLPVP